MAYRLKLGNLYASVLDGSLRWTTESSEATCWPRHEEVMTWYQYLITRNPEMKVKLYIITTAPVAPAGSDGAHDELQEKTP